MEYFVCEHSSLEERKPHVVEVNGTTVGIILLDGRVYAYENRCPHAEGPVCLGDVKGRIKTRLNENMETCGEYESQDEVNLICPWHGLEFDIATGACIPEPAYRLIRFETSVRDGKVYTSLIPVFGSTG